MFKCKLCEEKDARIYDLKDQIKSLNKLVFPSQNTSMVTPEDIELQQILSGSDLEVSKEDKEKLSKEVDSILMGSYDTSQVEII